MLMLSLTFWSWGTIFLWSFLTTHSWCLLISCVISKSSWIILQCLFILHIIAAKHILKSIKYDRISLIRFRSVYQYIQMKHLSLTSRHRCYSDHFLISYLRLLPINHWLLWAFYLTWSENQIKDPGALKFSWLYPLAFQLQKTQYSPFNVEGVKIFSG